MLLKMGRGVHPTGNKRITEYRPSERMPVPGRLEISMRQHLGEPASPLVAPGDRVYKGQVIASSDNPRVPPIHASTSGAVAEIGVGYHPQFSSATYVAIAPDGLDQWLPGQLRARDWSAMSPAEIIAAIKDAGIVGMGGAAFPTHVKLSPPADKRIDTLIANAAECEPYLTSDFRTMVEQPEHVVEGCRIVMKALGIDRCVIGIEDNKRAAADILERYCAGTGIGIAILETKYPQGAEKMLIRAIAGREVPSGKLPMDVGCVVDNVATFAAIAHAVALNTPLVERTVTVSGRAVRYPKNVIARIGTSFRDVFEFAGGFVEPPAKIIMGGPMMGVAQASIDAPVIKATSGLLAFTARETDLGEERPCIRCGKCEEVCPMRLRPNMLSILSERRQHQTAMAEYDLMDCVECGCCAFICPAKRNIVQYVKLSKAKNAALKKAAMRKEKAP
jgi:Na+-translocating ferredoxin:NAD+ oxidoreductase subunit C